MFTDPIADYLTRIRNANSAGHMVVDIPASKLKKEITKILYDQGYILSYKFKQTENHQGNIKIALKYDNITKEPVIKKIQRNQLTFDAQDNSKSRYYEPISESQLKKINSTLPQYLEIFYDYCS